MSSQAKFGYGTLVKMGDSGTPETFMTIPEIKGTISFSGMTSAEVDITTHNNAVNSRAQELMPGLIKLGSLDFEVNYLASDVTHVAMRNAFLNQTKKNFQLLTPQGDLTSCTGYITTFPPAYPDNAQISWKVKIMLANLPVFS